MNIGKSKCTRSGLELQIAPLIDVVFLLLIYFMVTATLVKKEGDISFMLPGPPGPVDLEVPVEALIVISENGTVGLEGMTFSSEDRTLNELVTQLMGLREIAASSTTKPLMVTVTPNRSTGHYRVIEVMDACAAAGVTALSFGQSTM